MDPRIYSVTSKNSVYSQLYPIGVDNFRVIIIRPVKQLNFKRFFVVLEFRYVLVGFVIYFSFIYLARKYILEDRSTPRCWGLAFSLLMETAAGQGNRQHHYFLSTNIAMIFYYFFMYVYCGYTTGRVIALMTDSAIEGRLTSLSSVRESNMELIITQAINYTYPQLHGLAEEFLRPLTVETGPNLIKSFHSNKDHFGVIFNGQAVQHLHAPQLTRRYYLVKESMSEYSQMVPNIITILSYHIIYCTGTILYTYYIRRDSVFQERIEQLVSRHRETGIPTKHTEWCTMKTNENFVKLLTPNDFTEIKFETFVQLMHFYIWGLLAICIVFVVELTYSKKDAIIGILRRINTSS